MKINRLGIVGARGMVGSVLLERLREKNDFDNIDDIVFFSTSQAGMAAPDIGRGDNQLADAYNIETLGQMDAILVTQGSDYTKSVHGTLRQNGWQGFWLDAANVLRMQDDAVIVLDPVNQHAINEAIQSGKRDFIGGNCTVSLMMLAIHGLLAKDLVEWITVASYQAISGAGANAMRELLKQMGHLHHDATHAHPDLSASILDIDRTVRNSMRSDSLARDQIGYTLAGSLLPWIDADLENGTSKEEYKGHSEANKILATGDNPIPIESLCVRIGTMRCHSQALTIKLKQDLPLDEINDLLDNANQWVHLVDNNKTDTLAQLTPTEVTGTTKIPVGRVRKLAMPSMISAFTVGDQLLWGAAEPIRRMLNIIEQH